jgi:hypothetical protein
LNGYQHPDEWGGGPAHDFFSKQAVLFAGTKSTARNTGGYINLRGPQHVCVDAAITDFDLPQCRWQPARRRNCGLL